MSASKVSLRPRERHAAADASVVAGGPQRPAGSAPASDEQQLPLSHSPPLSVACAQPADAISGSGVRLRVHGDLAEVEHEWKAFERQADRTVFQSFDWLAAWQRHIGARSGTVPAIVLGRDGDGLLLFILQLAVETHGPVRRLTWLGSQLCDYNAPLLAGQFSDRMSAERFVLAWRDVVALLRADPRFRFDLIDLQKMPGSRRRAAQPVPRPFRPRASERGLRGQSRPRLGRILRRQALGIDPQARAPPAQAPGRARRGPLRRRRGSTPTSRARSRP